MKKEAPCLDCRGQGLISKFNEKSSWSERCPNCGGTGTITVVVTNADCIRAMSDEELAWELMTWRLDAVARNHGIEGVYPDTQKEILKWLQSPTEEDT